ncbi:MAG: YggS family pyridoxal phosphate-dependent enzyme [Thermoflexales bacterium]|nr:YggS family pyridoxal phosphate-dependent enzyme [Thermoflexales bacterium]
MTLADTIPAVQDRIAAAARRAGRDPASVTLVAVTKTVPAEIVLEACQLGLRDFGENRVEAAGEKISNIKYQISKRNIPSAYVSPCAQGEALLPTPYSLLPTPHFHMIGHLQSRKAREAIDLFDSIHSVDSLKLADKLSRLCVEAGRVMPALLECNVSGEASKYGFQPRLERDWLAAVDAILALPGLRVEGLMTMAPVVSQPEQARPVFVAMRQLGQQCAARFGAEHFRHLSMGMTDDFEVAIEEGATAVRIGRALFGER